MAIDKLVDITRLGDFLAKLRDTFVEIKTASSPDLNDLTDRGCAWYCYGTLTHAPVSSYAAGWVVTLSAGSNDICVQVYLQYGSSNAASRRSVWMRVYATSWGDWYEIPSTAKDSDSPSFTASADFTLSSCSGKSRLGAVATIRLSVTTANALTSATSYVIGTIGSGWRPPVASYGRAADYRDNCWVSTNGQVTYRPGRAVNASTTLTMSFTYVLA